YALIVPSPLLATNKVFASGVKAIAMGVTPVATALPTWEAVPFVVFTERAVTFWSPTVATHMKWFVDPPRLDFTQPVNAPASSPNTITRTKDLVRIRLPLIERSLKLLQFEVPRC